MKFLEFLGKIWEKVWGLVLGCLLAVILRAVLDPWIPFMGYPELFRQLGEHVFTGMRLTGFIVKEVIFFTLFTFLYIYSEKVIKISLSRKAKVIATCLLLFAIIGIAFRLYPSYSKGVAIRLAREAQELASKAKETAEEVVSGSQPFRDSQSEVADSEYREKEFGTHSGWSDDKASSDPNVRVKASERKFWGRQRNIAEHLRDSQTAVYLFLRWLATSAFIRFLLVAMILMFIAGKKIAWSKKAGFILMVAILIFATLGLIGGDYNKDSVATPFSALMRKVPLVGIFFPPPPPPPTLKELGYRKVTPADSPSAGDIVITQVVPGVFRWAGKSDRDLGPEVKVGDSAVHLSSKPKFWVHQDYLSKIGGIRTDGLVDGITCKSVH